MTTPASGDPSRGPEPEMTPERWRAVDAILQEALACEPARRDAFVAARCAGDEAMRREVASLLASHRDSADDFLERPAAEAIPAPPAAPFVEDAVQRALHRYLDDRLQGAAEVARPNAAPIGASADVHDSRSFTSHSGSIDPPRRRTVSALAAMYVVTAALVVGLVGGLLIDRSSLLGRFEGAASDAAPSAEVVGSDVPAPVVHEGALTVVDREGRVLRTIPASRPWTPRFAPDGRRVAYGAFAAGRHSSDLWVTDVDAGTTRRLTEDEGDANDPQWSPDGETVAFSANAPGGKDVVTRRLGGGRPQVVASRDRTQFPSDWSRDGSALLVAEQTDDQHDILVQPVDGSPAVPYAATSADETTARISPDGRWVAYTSNASGSAEVYLDSYPQPRRRVKLSSGGGIHPVWRGDGRELYYWRNDELVAVPLGASLGGAAPGRGDPTVLFRGSYPGGVSTMYDVSRDGKRFVIVR
jgi:hypothetical protein